MSKMVLLSVYLDNGNQPREAEKNLGLVNTRGGTQLLQIKGKANTIYRLVDEQTGQVVKKQFLLLKGKKLQVVVNQTTVVEIDNFLPDARSSYEPDKNAPAYVVDTGIDDIQLGLMKPDSPVITSVNNLEVVWMPGMQATEPFEAQAFAMESIAALSPLTNHASHMVLGAWTNDNLSSVDSTNFTTGKSVQVVGGQGNDTMTGGAANDTLTWFAGDAGTTTGAVDIVKSFGSNSSSDKLDISKLLTNGYVSGTSTLSQWVTSVTTAQTSPGGVSGSTRIVIDPDSTTGSSTVTQTIWLEGLNLTSIDPAVLKTSGVLIA